MNASSRSEPKGKTILVVDDDPGFLLALSETLRDDGHEAFTASTGKEAAAWIRKNPADLVFLDMELPDTEGCSLMRQLRKERPKTPFVVISGCEDGKRIVNMMRQGAHDYLIKNGTLFDLLPGVLARVFVDVKRTEELDRANRLLRENEARFAAALAATQDGIWEWNIADDTFYLSPRWKELLGYRNADLADDRAEWESRIHPEDLERVRQAVRECLAGDRSRLRIEYRLRDREGTYRWVLSQGIIHRDGAGRAVRIVGALSDQTERLEMEMQLRQMQKMEAIGKLAGGVAHDFNNILAVIQSHLWILEKGDAEEQAASRNEIDLATQRAAALTRQLLVFSRKQVIQPKDLDLNALILGMGKMLGRSLGEDIEIVFDLCADAATMKADTGMMEQILLNLAVNARDAMPTGGKLTFSTARVTLAPGHVRESAGRSPGNYVRLQVEDTGCGIPEEIRSRIFEPFFTTKEMTKGTGLGLATVHGIVKQHQGWIEISSTVGQGTVFRLFFPATECAGPIAPCGTERPPESRGRETIFLVEDDAAVRVPIRTFLTHMGYTLIEAASGAEALALYDKSRPKIDLLLTDMVMPGGVNGKTLAEMLLKRIPDLKVIYTSGYDMELLTPDMALKEGFNFLQKPVLPSVMAKTIRSVLDEAAARNGAKDDKGEAKDPKRLDLHLGKAAG